MYTYCPHYLQLILLQLGIMDTLESADFDTNRLHHHIPSEKLTESDTIFHISPLAELKETMITPVYQTHSELPSDQLSSCKPPDVMDPQSEPSLVTGVKGWQ